MSKQNSMGAVASFSWPFCLCLYRVPTRGECGRWVVSPDGPRAAEAPDQGWHPPTLPGPIGYAGMPDANVAKMVVKVGNNAAGGLRDGPLELCIKITGRTISSAYGNVSRAHSARQGRSRLGRIQAPAQRDQGCHRCARQELSLYPQLYDETKPPPQKKQTPKKGQRCTPYLFCTGPEADQK